MLTSKNDTSKNHNLRVISESDDDDNDDVDSSKNTTNTNYHVSYESEINSKNKNDDSAILKTPTKKDSIDDNDSHKSINSSSGIMSSNDHTRDEYEINDEDSIHQDDTPRETVIFNHDKQPPATDNEEKKPPKRSLTKPTTRSEIKKEIKRLTTDIERSKIFLMQGNCELLPDGGKNIRKSILKNQESLNEYKKQLEQMEDNNSSVASTDLSHNLSSDKENSMNYPNYNPHNSPSVNSPEVNSNSLNFDRKKLLKPTANTVTEGLGKRALETFQKEQALTVERLEHLHGSLISQPSENEQVKDPKGLVIHLMPHQKHALAWLTWREKQKPPGGVLADDMGLGKTLTMISLVIKSLADSSIDDDVYDGDNIENQECKYQGGTIVVCPASLINQWKNEIDTRCKRGVLVTEVYHGNNREKVPRRLARNDIVITTYNLLVRESKNNGQLFQIQWKRVILDEAHAIRNHKSQACEAVCQLKAKKRWALTGTPIHNKGMDIFAILKFLKCSPFDDIRIWKRWVENKSDAGVERLAMVMKSLMLRRTKNELINKGDIDSLPEKHLEIIKISLDKDERLVYDKVMMYSRTFFAQFLHQRAEKEALVPLGVANKFKNSFNKAQQQLLARHADVQTFEILVLLLRLRQICCQPSLIHDMLDKQEIEIDGADGGEYSGQSQNNLVAQLEGLNISRDASDKGEENEAVGVDKRISEHLLTSENPVFNPKRCSSKLTVILNLVRDILAKREKLIIVSQWSTYLQIIGENLRTVPGATFEMFTGAVAVKNRQGIINSFNKEKNPKIMLLSLCAGGVGLNLVGANHLILVDIHWNPQLECQACDRIYRIGQKKNVYIYKLICNDTIEETIQKLQEEKLSLANSILTGKNKESSKISVQDLMTMFS
ncbi:GSCOCG00007156001-RA-CDS [Cotesia congregata]|uniref:Transcription termination factor 2 n=1 Tax=Cotesia congregata TaxID=51543 RepID=A0A8J2HEA8_COTCN|nr:GSCOCG00007156001-RA-CDS [Cotesia congregata]CAG5092843.1 Similar to lds: Transcription termination factor 2 (Drosophila melanogaster) [Cotesia congregata]